MRFIDGLRKYEKKVLVIPQKIKKRFNYWYFIIPIILIGIIFLISFSAKAVNGKLDVLRLFKAGKYLVIFQNNSELRPTGGFIGSFAVIEFSDYKIKNIDFNTNIYKLDKVFSQDHIVSPPAPLEEISNGRWALRDSNFAVSYPESAKQIEWFFKEETGQDIDGIIAVNASVVRDLIKLSGPINLEKYNTTITFDNFFTELTTKIEKDYFLDTNNKTENEPKTILKDMMPIVFERISQNKLSVIKLLYNELNQKQILFYSKNSEIEDGVLTENWGGEVQKSNSDYLFVNQTNISGGKSSVSVNEGLNYKVTKDGGLLLGNLTITRSHAGSIIWPDGINRNWTRVLVPEGSLLKAATMDGKDISKKITEDIESGKTSFGFWTETAPQTSTVVILTYVLPISEHNYSLLVQKQPGNLGDNLEVLKDNKVLFNGVLDTDKEIR